MTKVQFRRRVIRAVEWAIYMIVLFAICLVVCFAAGLMLSLMGVG